MRIVLGVAGGFFGLVLSLPLLLVTVPLWLVSRFTRALADRLEPASVPWEDLMQFEPVIGWRPKPGLDTYGMVEDVFHLVTDAEGWRGLTTIEEADAVVFGDSFAFGQGMDEDSFFANLSTRVRLKGIGANGYNMVQELLWMDRLRDRLQGKFVIWFVFHGNDLFENLQPNLMQYRMPFVRRERLTGEWEIVTRHVNPERWTTSTGRDYYRHLAEICCRTELSRRALGACSFLLERGVGLCREAGARLIVVSIPEVTQIGPRIRELEALAPAGSDFDPARPDRALRLICGRLGVPFIPLAGVLGPEHYKTGDPHWNKNGHACVARSIGRVVAGSRQASNSMTAREVLPV